MRGRKLCLGCGQPMLRKGQKRKHRDDYRHAYGCPLAPAVEARQTHAFWKKYMATISLAERKGSV